MRVDLYAFVHKAQRFHLFRLSEVMGSADLSQAQEAEKIVDQLKELLEHLRDHADNEKRYIHPLYQQIGSVGEYFDGEHESLEAEIQKIEKVVQENHGSDLYVIYARFLGVYLLHLDEEETAQREILWKNYEDKVLGEAFMRFKAERPSHLAQKDFEFMLPALSIPELTQMFRGMKASVSEQAFVGACDVAAKLLAKTKWDKVIAAIAG